MGVTKRARVGVLLAVGMLAAWSGGEAARAQGPAMRLQIGDPAPDFALEEFSSKKRVALSDYLGRKVVMLDFWATWCDICVAEIPRLVEEYETLRPRGYELLAVTLSRGDRSDRRRIGVLKEKHGISYPLLMDTTFEVATKTYGLAGLIPLKVIIDCQGIIRSSHVGDSPGVIREIEKLLEDPACQP